MSTTKFFAVCNVNGPISIELDGSTKEEALASFEAVDPRRAIDAASTDIEDALGVDGSDMSESDFAEAIEAAGAECMRSLSPIENAHAGTTAHLSGGWTLYRVETDEPSKGSGYWAIDTGDGNELSNGLAPEIARQAAQRAANERGESVYLYEVGSDAESEEIEPEGLKREDAKGGVVIATVEPVTLSGWYERTDGTVGKYSWHAGHVVLLRVVPGWSAVPSRDEELESAIEAGAI